MTLVGVKASQHVREAWGLIAPPSDGPHGPLPPLLLLLTVVTGLIDAFSYLLLSHVLVANMTGNVVFLGFAVGGAPGFLWWASLLAIGTFLLGALLGGRLIARMASHRARHLAAGAILETVLVGLAWVLSLVVARPYTGGVLAIFLLLLGVAMGLQNATARRLSVPDLTTTVLTLTITGIAADAGSGGSRLGRRLVPIVSMFLGGLIGALLVVNGHVSLTLLVATVLLAVVALVASLARSSQASWVRGDR